jgi:hypothetical protein
MTPEYSFINSNRFAEASRKDKLPREPCFAEVEVSAAFVEASAAFVTSGPVVLLEDEFGDLGKYDDFDRRRRMIYKQFG